MLPWDAGTASRSPPGCSGDTKRHRLVDSVSLIDHGKRPHLVTCRERSGRVTGDFVVRTAPARTIFAPFPLPAMEGRFLLISFNASSKGRGKTISFVPFCQSHIPGGLALLPSGVSIPGEQQPD